MFDHKMDVIENYEVKILDRMKDSGFTHEILFPLAELFPDEKPNALKKTNVTHHYWDLLIDFGFPFVKIDLILNNPMNVPMLHSKAILRKHGVDFALFFDHLEQRKVQKKHAQRPAWRRILSDINRARRDIRRRKLERRHNVKKQTT